MSYKWPQCNLSCDTCGALIKHRPNGWLREGGNCGCSVCDAKYMSAEMLEDDERKHALACYLQGMRVRKHAADVVKQFCDRWMEHERRCRALHKRRYMGHYV